MSGQSSGAGSRTQDVSNTANTIELRTQVLYIVGRTPSLADRVAVWRVRSITWRDTRRRWLIELPVRTHLRDFEEANHLQYQASMHRLALCAVLLTSCVADAPDHDEASD